MPGRLLPASLLLAVSLGALTGCSDEREPSTVRADGSADAETMDCEGRPVEVGGKSFEWTLVGECPDVSVAGSDIDINLDGVELGTLTILGDRNEIDDAARPTEVTVRGHDNEVDATDIGALLLAGDRNDVDARSEIHLVTIEGDDNRVETDYLGQSSEDGSGNQVVENG
jgi:hypothetical protein